MKMNRILSLVTGFAAGAAAAYAARKVADEIKGDLSDMEFTSPEGNRHVTLSYGASETAKSLAYIRVKAAADDKEDTCELVAFAKKGEEFLKGEWSDNDNFSLLIGTGKRKQCCDISFSEEEISANLYFMKVTV